ncbi:MAG: putative serine protease PepD [Frankiaceae bacterium]|jgi:putative serine protease PepD|nr:putative serine protease PepD [Frankiaceae bacterium]
MTERGPDEQPRTWWSQGEDPWSSPAQLPSYGGQPYSAAAPAETTLPGAPTTDTALLGTTPSPWGGWETATGAPPRRPERQVGLGVVAGVAAVSALLAAILGGFVGARLHGDSKPTNSSASLGTSNGTVIERAPGSIASIAGKVLPSVVSIKVVSSQGSGTGSGWVVNGEGYLITNNHVIASAASGGGTITVAFSDGTTEPGRIVGRAETLDIAVLKVADLHGAKALPLGDSEQIAVGDPVIAIGSPLGLAGTVTSGIVSAVHRAVDTGDASGDPGAALDAVQTDAAINPGNSGGPLVDSAGRVIGVNSAIASLGSGLGGQSGSIGVGFAIPINTVKKAGEQIIRTGKATRPILGVLLVRDSTVDGALVGCDQAAVCQPISPGGPAAQAGLRDGDVIVRLNATRIDSATTLILELRRHRIGEQIKLLVKRGGRQLTKTVTLGSGTA